MTISSLNAASLNATASNTPLLASVAVRNSTASMPATTSAGTATSSALAPTPSVIVTLSGATTAPLSPIYSPQPVTPPPAWQNASIAIKTASGRNLTLSLGDDGGLSLKPDGDAPLSNAESVAIAKLAVAFKNALDGMASSSPQLDLAGLAQVDTSVLSSIHITAQASGTGKAIQTVDFTADATSRSVKIDGQAGNIDVSVDLSSPALSGSQTQQASAINNYLRQFDQAASRGHASPALMTMFKDAFTQMNAPAGLDAVPLTRPSTWVTETDHALLSGLADFSASVTQTATASNPYRANEHDAFSLQVSQTTQMSGRDPSERGISQTSSSQLRASFHTPLSADAPLNLTGDPKSQNYYYTQIDDSAQSNMKIGYQKGKLVQASLTRTASQNTQQQKYVMGQMVEDITTPLKRTQQRDLLPLLDQMNRHPPQTQQERDARKRDLANLHDSVLFESDPTALA